MRLRRVFSGVLLLVVATTAVVVVAADRSGAPGPDTASAATPLPRSPASRPSPSPPPLTEEQLFQMAERKRFGLQSSPDYIRSLDRQEFPSYFFSVPLTAAEIAEFERRHQVTEAFGPIEKLLKKRTPATYGGIWIDQEAGGVGVVATTDPATFPLADVRALLPAGGELRVQTVQHSEAALHKLDKKLGADWDELADLDINVLSTAVLTMENAFEVRLRFGSPEADVVRLLERYGYARGLRVRIMQGEAGVG